MLAHLYERLNFFGKKLNQYLDFCITDKLLRMLIFYPSYVIKHFLYFHANSAYFVLYYLKVQKLSFHYVKSL